MFSRRLFLWLLLFWAGVSSFACTAVLAETETIESNWHFSVGVGAGVRTNPVQYASDIPIILLPQVEYSGERFFIQNLDMGFIISENKTHQINLVLTPSYDQIFFDRWNSGNFFVDIGNNVSHPVSNTGGSEVLQQPGMDSDKTFDDNDNLTLHKRRITALGGVEYNFSSTAFDWQLHWVTDLLDVHNGNEIRFFVSKDWQQNRSRLKASLGVVWQDEKTLDYYYGLTPQETAADSIYHPDASVSALLRLDWHYRLTENWDLRLFSSYRHLGDEITQSPLIDDDKIVTLFVGGVYHF